MVRQLSVPGPFVRSRAGLILTPTPAPAVPRARPCLETSAHVVPSRPGEASRFLRSGMCWSIPSRWTLLTKDVAWTSLLTRLPAQAAKPFRNTPFHREVGPARPAASAEVEPAAPHLRHAVTKRLLVPRGLQVLQACHLQRRCNTLMTPCMSIPWRSGFRFPVSTTPSVLQGATAHWMRNWRWLCCMEHSQPGSKLSR